MKKLLLLLSFALFLAYCSKDNEIVNATPSLDLSTMLENEPNMDIKNLFDDNIIIDKNKHISKYAIQKSNVGSIIDSLKINLYKQHLESSFLEAMIYNGGYPLWQSSDFHHEYDGVTLLDQVIFN